MGRLVANLSFVRARDSLFERQFVGVGFLGLVGSNGASDFEIAMKAFRNNLLRIAQIALANYLKCI